MSTDQQVRYARDLGAARAYLTLIPSRFNVPYQTAMVFSALTGAYAHLTSVLRQRASQAPVEQQMGVYNHTIKAAELLSTMPASYNVYSGMGPVVGHLRAAGAALIDALEAIEPHSRNAAATARAALADIPDPFVTARDIGYIVSRLQMCGWGVLAVVDV